MVSKKSEWVLTHEAFYGLLNFLDSDPARAAREYEQIRQRLMNLFRWRGCLTFEEYTDQTIDRVARRLVEGGEIRTSNRYALFHGVALNIIYEHWRKTERELRALDGFTTSRQVVPNPENIIALKEEEHQRQAQVECLRRCLRTLSDQNLKLIKEYYAEGKVQDKNQRKRLADSLSVSLSALRVKAFRIRVAVEKCVQICLEQGPQGEILPRTGH